MRKKRFTRYRLLAAGLKAFRDELRRERRPGSLVRGRLRLATMMLKRLFGSDFRYMRLALKAQAGIQRKRPARAAAAARKLAASAPGPAQRAVADDLLEAVEAGALERAARITAHARLSGNLGAEKIVSRKHGFFWICNPKAASRSLIRALRAADPEAELFSGLSAGDVLALRPEARDYFSFTFVRNPFHRTVSFYRDKFLQKPEEMAGYERMYPSLSADMGFEALCVWLAGPYGADAFANRHWLSQHLQIVTAPGRMPDFVGRYETLEDDFRTVARRIGLPGLRLPLLNTAAGFEPSRREAEAARRATGTYLTDRVRELLRRRYADDFRILGYDPG